MTRVAGGAAELGGIHALDAACRCRRRGCEGVDPGGGEEDEGGPAHLRAVEVEDGELDGGIVLGEGLEAALPGLPQADGDEGETETKSAGRMRNVKMPRSRAAAVLAHEVDGEENREEGGDRWWEQRPARLIGLEVTAAKKRVTGSSSFFIVLLG